MNPYRVEISYAKALNGRGSVISYMALTLERAKELAAQDFAGRQGRGGAAHIVISHNEKVWPQFDWRVVEEYTLGARRGGARAGAGRKPKDDARVVLSARVQPQTAEALREIAGGRPLGVTLDEIILAARKK